MAQTKALQFAQGETWRIQIACVDQSGVAQDITGGEVQFRMANPAGLVLDLSLQAAGSNFATGNATIVVGVNDTAIIDPGLYFMEARSVLSDGTVTDQFTGSVYVAPSLFVKYPYTAPTSGSGGELDYSDGGNSALIGH